MLQIQQLHEWYVEDLTHPDPTHHRDYKVKFREPWIKLQSVAKADFREIDLNQDYDVWVWSDIHFGHKNIIAYENRPFANADEMNEALIKNYVSVVKPNDVVIWCGDISFMNVNRTNALLETLPGYKIHIVGNHDLDRSGNVLDINMDERHPCYVLPVSADGLDFELLFTHYPLTNMPEGVNHNIHGHIHGKVTGWDHSTNVSVEHTNFTPKNLKAMLSDIAIQAKKRS